MINTDEIARIENGDKLFAWIMSMIDINEVEYMRTFVPVRDMIKQVSEEEYSEVKSKYYIGGNVYEFKMSLEKWDCKK